MNSEAEAIQQAGEEHRLNILPAMADPRLVSDQQAARRLDRVAVNAALRRLGAAKEAPWLHGEVARRMAERLAIIRLKPERLVDWWSFLGTGAELLNAAYPKAQRLVVEPTADLLERSKAALQRPWWSAARWTGGGAEAVLDALDTPWPEASAGAQLVWANMMLHFVVDPPALFERWQRALGVDGFVMFSCLGPGTLRELRAIYQKLGWPAPTPGFIDMHDLGDMLVQAGFADPVMDQETLTLSWESSQALLTELHTLGGNTAPERQRGLRTPRWRAQLEHALEALRGADGRLSLSFEVAYGHAFKAAPRLRPGEETTVSLDDMRAMVRSGRGAGPQTGR
ncbi:methyltransferase domain-containing protein [soil metagenome]